jgi:hypothetical protein
MDIRRLGTRSLANLAYAYLVTNAIETAVGTAEQNAVQQKRDLKPDERQRIVQDALAEFNRELEADIIIAPGVDAERVSRARDNLRAIAGLTEAFERANVGASD